MTNLFVVNTTFQLLTAYILAKSMDKDKNYLITLHPPNHKMWREEHCLGKIYDDNTVWQKNVVVEKWFERLKTKKEIEQHVHIMEDILCQFEPIQRVFLGCDKGYQRQLLVEMTGNDSFFRFDEGIGSYWSPKRKMTSKLYLSLRVAIFRHLAGVSTNLRYNYDGIGYSKSAIADYLYKTDVIMRPSPNVLPIQGEIISKAVDYLVDDLDVNTFDPDNESIWFLGSNLSEFGMLTEEEEKNLVRDVYDLAQRDGLLMVYKSHPSESQDKLSRFQKAFPLLKFLNSYDPVELYLAKSKNIRCIISHLTSTLVYGDTFCTKPINKISILRFVKDSKISKEAYNIYINILTKAGVKLPESMQELAKII